MKVIGFVGSPRKSGNTDLLVQEALKGAREAGAETRIFYPNDLKIRGCQACFGCKKTGSCVLKDDMTPIYQEIISAQGIIFGSPVYMWGMTAQMKLVFDRLFAFLYPNLSSRLPKGIKSAFIFTQGNPDKKGFSSYFDSVGSVTHLIGFNPPEILVAAGINEPGAVAKDAFTMGCAKAIGQKLAAT